MHISCFIVFNVCLIKTVTKGNYNELQISEETVRTRYERSRAVETSSAICAQIIYKYLIYLELAQSIKSAKWIRGNYYLLQIGINDTLMEHLYVPVSGTRESSRASWYRIKRTDQQVSRIAWIKFKQKRNAFDTRSFVIVAAVTTILLRSSITIYRRNNC